MNFDVSILPFSKYGSYLSVTLEKENNTFMLRNCRRLFGEEQFMAFIFTDSDGKPVDITVEASPSHIEATSKNGSAVILLRGDEEMLVSTQGMGVITKPCAGWCFKIADNGYRFHRISNHNYTTDIKAVKGRLVADIRTETVNNYHQQTKTELTILPENDGMSFWGVQISSFEVHYNLDTYNIDDEIRKVDQNWQTFMSVMPKVHDNYQEAALGLWYNLWSSVIRASGNMKYDAMLMSKSYMCAVWSWDHCFNALALLASGNVEGALEQFFLPFEMQSPEGKLPDLINTEIDWRAAVKPPIHGWCFNIIMDKAELSHKILEKAYKHLSMWTEWHFRYRDTDNDGIPEYIMGNDSGWDNSTVFDMGTNIETPDLPAYLFLQMKALQRIAVALNIPEEANEWDKKSENLMEAFMNHSWENGCFVAKQSDSHQYDPKPTSLLTLMPIVMGEYLVNDTAALLVERIKESFVTDYGIATESIHSSKYTPNGYWRGPIWAPTTYLVIDGLRRGGYPDLARDIAKRFCATVAKSGSYENYDALTGEGLCDRGYTWTSSAALCLMHEYRHEL